MSPHREVIQAALAQDGIPTAIYYSKPLPFQPALSHLHHVAGDFPVAEAASLEVFSLPMHPHLEDAQIKRTAEIIKGAVDKAS
jgi:dTDP-4-amino-4,6-dideoxygalactose transaminase